MPRAWAIAATAVLASCTGASDNVVMPALSEHGGPPYAIEGLVMDANNQRVEGANVEILDGPHADATTVTDAAGRYRFDQPFTVVPRMHAWKDDFVTEHQGAYVAPNRSIIEAWFRLSRAAPIAIAGEYTLTFIADSVCTALPQEARIRTYQTTINRAASQKLTLRGAAFVADAGHTFNSPSLHVSSDRVTLSFGHADIWEQLDGGRSVYLTGDAQGAFTGAVSELRFGGGMGFCGITGPGARCDEHVPCVSADHMVTLTRR
jgi:hypothetical protein